MWIWGEGALRRAEVRGEKRKRISNLKLEISENHRRIEEKSRSLTLFAKGANRFGMTARGRVKQARAERQPGERSGRS
jgi:hypothetical protein